MIQSSDAERSGMTDTTAPAPRIGLIGAGNAGQAMVEALSQHFALSIFDLDSERFRGLGERVAIAESAAHLASQAELVVLSLPNPAASLSVAAELREVLRPGTIVLETSTVRPEDIEALHVLLAPAGAMVIDAAFVGGVAALAQGRAAVLVGADQDSAGIARQVLDRLAEDIFYLGPRGKGMATKLVVNAVAHATYVVLVEAGALAAAQDIPMSVMQGLLERESGLMRPLVHRFGERLPSRDFEGGMSTANAAKDSRLVLDAADALGVPLFAIPAAHTVYELAMREGLERLDYASIGLLWEKWLGVDFVADGRPGDPPD
jgi:3-hydroxyisobutyrate dehydrogenase-like beta-hydroxyacid dehydrogenase